MATDSHYKAEDYTVGWICALPVELAASAEMLDKEHPQLLQDMKDSNSYTFGSIGEHNIVIGCLPFGQTGVVSAASVAMQMKSRFKSIRLGLMVGIGGGVPSGDADIRLGDVVVSRPSGQHGGVVQYDLGKTGPAGRHIRTGSLDSPPQILLTALATVEALRIRERFTLLEHLAALGRRLPKFAYPQALQDDLYKPTYVHPGGATCTKCIKDELEERDERDSTDVVIHYGTIASGNQVMKDGVARDRLSGELGGILCFEMEAAGLMNNFPCLVIRGICDYADSHKNKGWQPYAAATAAAFAKGLLGVIPANQVAMEPTINEAMKELAARVAENTEISRRVEETVLTAGEDKILDWLSSTNFSKPQNTARETRTSGTGQWLLGLKAYTDWRDSSQGLLWLYGAAGCGKTVLCSTAIEDLQNDRRKRSAYWYFQFSDDATQRICNMVRSFIRQLSMLPLPAAINRLWQDHKIRGSDPGIEELAKALDEVINSLGGEIFIIIDALDECPRTGDRPERDELLKLINSLLDRGSRSLHLLATSRQEPDIYKSLSGRFDSAATAILDIEPLVGNDIKQFVETALAKESKLSRWDDTIKRQIKERLVRTSETRFRWADLQIKRLRDCMTEHELIEALHTVPESLEKTYEGALQKIPGKYVEKAQSILIWLTSSLRPMTLKEIAAVVSLPFPEDVLQICTSLLVTLIHEDTNEIIKLAHFSVKEYLILKECQVEGLVWYRFSNQLAQATIAEATISYLLETSNTDIYEQIIFIKPLLQYSAEFWPQHARAVTENLTDRPRLRMKIDMMFSPEYSQSYLNWLRIYDCDQYGSRRFDKTVDQFPRPLYYASLLGFDHTVETLIRSGVKISAEGGTFENAFPAAAIHGHSKIVARLLDGRCRFQKRDISRIVRDMKRNIKETIRVLLDAGALTSVSGKSETGGIQVSEWVVKAAAANWENGKEVMTVLLDQPGVHGLITEEVVKAAAGNWGSGKEVVALLLDQLGTGVLITEGVVQAAAKNGRNGSEVVTLLLDRRRADVKITDKVVQAAVGNRMNGVEVITVLLNRRGSDVQITSEVVKEAARNAKSGKKVMTLLLDRPDSDVRITREALETIVKEFDEDIIGLILDRRGADVRITEDVLKAAIDEDISSMVESYLTSSAFERTDSRSKLGTKSPSLDGKSITSGTVISLDEKESLWPDDIWPGYQQPQPVFHNFLRAFYPFHPTYSISDSTVTLPLNEGDVILVHSIPTNGWADGTLLISGARGWLPTNYCEAYDADSMRNLLQALLNFWDLLGSGMTSDNEIFGNQEFMRGIIAGVRYLLENSNCLTRESHLVQSNEGLRRNRKALLSDLSALVKTAKKLQEYTSPQPTQAEVDDVNNTIDEMILKAFKIVTRGIRFLDILEDDLRSRQQPIHRRMATVAEEAYNPSTPPADSTSLDGTQHGDSASDAASCRSSSHSSGSGLSGSQRLDEQTKRQSYKRMSTSYPSNTLSRPLSFTRPSSIHIKRQSISHRLSATLPAAQRQNLISERLNSNYDTFLSYLGSFIGRLHLQSQSSADLISTVRQSVTAGQELLQVVEVICAHDNQSAEALDAARNAMYDRINQLVVAAREIITQSGIEDEDVVMPQQNGRLLMAATGCVKAAGECVAKTKFVIERIGDFEFEPQNEGLGIDIASIGVVAEEEPRPSVELAEDSPAEPASRPPPPPLIIPSYEKPLPEVPLGSPAAIDDGIARLSPTAPAPVAKNTAAKSTMTGSKKEARKSLLPPLPKMTSPLMGQEEYSPSEHSSAHDSEFQTSFRTPHAS